jgi:hypothetical protein
MGAGAVVVGVIVGVVVYFITQALLTTYKIKDVLAPLTFGLGVPFVFAVVAFVLVLLLMGSGD